MQCLGLGGAFGSWLVIPLSEPVLIVRLGPKVTLLTLRSASLTLRQQNHGLDWEPTFFHRKGRSGLGWEHRWCNGRSQSRCCGKINKAFEEYSPYTDCAVAMLAGNRPKHHTTVLPPANISKNLPYYSSSGLWCFQWMFLFVGTKANRLSQNC